MTCSRLIQPTALAAFGPPDTPCLFGPSAAAGRPLANYHFPTAITTFRECVFRATVYAFSCHSLRLTDNVSNVSLAQRSERHLGLTAASVPPD